MVMVLYVNNGFGVGKITIGVLPINFRKRHICGICRPMSDGDGRSPVGPPQAEGSSPEGNRRKLPFACGVIYMAPKRPESDETHW